MVSCVSRVPRPRLTNEPPREMAERFSRELERLQPGHPALLLPFDALLADRLEDAIAEVRRARYEPQPEMVKRLQDEFGSLLIRYHERWLQWREAIKQARNVAGSSSQAIMNLLPPDWEARDFPPRMHGDQVPRFRSYEEGRRACDEQLCKVLEVETFIAGFHRALEFDAQEPGEQARRMVCVLFEKLCRAAERIERLEGELKQLQRSNNSKRKAA